jgi:hypothetical protein
MKIWENYRKQKTSLWELCVMCFQIICESI